MSADGEFDAAMKRWRQRALDYVLLVAVGLGLVPLLSALLVVPTSLPVGFRLTSLGVYAVMVVLAVARRAPHEARAWVFLSCSLVLATMMLAARGLQGHGRIMLVILPLYATVFLGAPAGYAVGALSLAVFAVTGALTVRGSLDFLAIADAPALTGQLWFLQGSLLVFALGMTLVLVSQFVGRLRQTLETERAAARQVAEAAEDRRRLEGVLLETGERERRTVGHQLHDGPCQQLTAALLRCRVAQNARTADAAAQQASHLQAIAGMLESAVGEIHDLARGLAPPELSPDALPAALADLARATAASGGVDCGLRHDGCTVPDDQEAASQLFRIAQEAVSNAVRHANASIVEIELARGDAGLRLVVRDDGVGMSAGAAAEGMGLRIMRHRAEVIGASLAVDTAPRRGTAVTCVLPEPAATGEIGGGG